MQLRKFFSFSVDVKQSQFGVLKFINDGIESPKKNREAKKEVSSGHTHSHTHTHNELCDVYK